MSDLLIDQLARDRFRTEWDCNFAVSANAGSGKTTSISERLAGMALSPEAAPLLRKTAVVTFTKKAASQIGQRARQVLLRRLAAEGGGDLRALEHVEHVFFGTIHSFCLLLAQRYGQTSGINLNPGLVVEEDSEEDALWEAFVEQDPMQFTSLTAGEVQAFLRHVPLEDVFPVARGLSTAAARRLAARRPAGPLPAPSAALLEQMLAVTTKSSRGRANLEASQRAARLWDERFRAGAGFLPLYKATSKAGGLDELAEAWMAPLKAWLADAAAVLAAELSTRYRSFRLDRGVQTYADQIDAAVTVLHDPEMLDAIRADGWRVILDEAQDTDSQQFAVLVEITRPPGAPLGTWPQGGGEPPRPGHFCMVGDGQQAIYGARADIRNFTRHLDAFRRGDGGYLLVFQVTFRAPRRVIDVLNAGFPAVFGPERDHNLGLPPAPGAEAPLLQVRYEPLEPSAQNEEGRAERLPLLHPGRELRGVDAWMEEEVRQIAAFIKGHSPSAFGVAAWSDVCILAPRVDWLVCARKVFEKAGVKTALQIRRTRNADTPAYAWLAGLMAAVCDPDNMFEWYGVLREVFALSDALLADELRARGAFEWAAPDVHAPALRTALETIRPWVLCVDEEGLPLGRFADGLAGACNLRAKARAIDPQGLQEAELDRLLAEAALRGIEGASPRQWLGELLAGLDRERPSGGVQDDAVNLLTSHSAKGLEWPVVIPIGLWRSIGKPPEKGLRLVAETGAPGDVRLYFDQASLPSDTRESRERERLRELVRLLYVTFTRARQRLVIPWMPGFGDRRGGGKGFAALWGADALFDSLPEVAPEAVTPVEPPQRRKQVETAKTAPLPSLAARAAGLPRRVLPHELAVRPDQTRGFSHETSIDRSLPRRVADGDEAIDYGLWWHQTMEFMPWTGDAVQVERHLADARVAAVAKGFGERGAAELARLQASPVWADLRASRWERLAELAILAPLTSDGWIDGVIDLTLHDGSARCVWVLDWKTNRRLAGEEDDALLQRLAKEYEPQLSAYGRGLANVFPAHEIRLWVYSSAAGRIIEIKSSPEGC